MANPEQRMMRSLNRLTKWRVFFTGWQLGTRSKEDPEAAAVRDINEARLIVRAELTAITRLLLQKEVFTKQEFQEAIAAEADACNELLAARFPGVKATDEGLVFDKRAADTMRGWKP